ncbi:MAG: F0F1 ATP synthase subunit B [Patescibacteria group bacterium]
MEILANLGIDSKLFAAQLVNFALLLFILHRFLYKPLLVILQKRSETIEKSLKEAAEIEQRVKETAKMQEEILATARGEAQAILVKAQAIADEKQAAAVEKAEKKVAAVIVDAKEKIAAEKRQMLTEAREELGGLVITAVEKILETGLSKQIPEKLIADVVEKTKKSI